MSQVRGAANNRKVPIRVCMALVMVVVPVSAALLLPGSASALSFPLLDKTTSLVTPALRGATDVLLPSPAPQPSVATNDTSPPSGTTPIAGAADASSRSVVAPRANQSPEPMVQSDAPLATVAPLDTTWLSKPVAATTTSTHYTSPDVDQSARAPIVDSVAILQPTEQGWSLFGVLWCWWLIGMALVGMGIYTIVRRGSHKTNLVS